MLCVYAEGTLVSLVLVSDVACVYQMRENGED